MTKTNIKHKQNNNGRLLINLYRKYLRKKKIEISIFYMQLVGQPQHTR